MLVRRERRYTLFFRLPQPLDSRDMDRIKNWNDKVCMPDSWQNRAFMTTQAQIAWCTAQRTISGYYLQGIWNSCRHVTKLFGVWGSADKCHLNKILILQKRALRFIYFAEWKEHAIPFFLNADILPVNFLYYENVCSLMHDVRHKTAPENIIDLFTDIKSVHSYNTRSSTSHNFYIKQSKLQIQYKSFSRLGARIWNDIPVSLREKPKRIFKSELHRALLNVLKTHDDYLDISQIGKAVKLL